jgi:hypothetical protein
MNNRVQLITYVDRLSGERWTLSKVAAFANRVGGLVASRAGSIPEWSLSEVAVL